MPARKKNKQRLVNLLPKEDFERTMLGRILRWALTSFRYIVIVVEFVVILGFLSRFWLDVQISDLDDEINQKTALISSKSTFENNYRRLQKQLDIYGQITKSSYDISPLLEIAVNNLPQDAKLNSFRVEGSTLEITGSSLTEGSIGSYLQSLTNQDVLSDVVLKKIEAPSDVPFIEFTIDSLIQDTGT